MKKFVYILTVLLIAESCGSSGSFLGSSIPSSFFGNSFGESISRVDKTISRSDLTLSYESLPSYTLIPMGIENRKVQSFLFVERVPFGGFNWRTMAYMFDFRDRLFCTAFIQEYNSLESARARYNDIKGSLDSKYGQGHRTEYGVIYGERTSRSVSVAVVPDRTGKKWACGLYYLDDKIYQRDTAFATKEL